LFSFILSPGVFCLSTSTTAQHFLLYCCIWNDAHFDRKCLASLCNSLWQTYVYSYATKLSAPSICARVLHLVLVCYPLILKSLYQVSAIEELVFLFSQERERWIQFFRARLVIVARLVILFWQEMFLSPGSLIRALYLFS
jgi:hypothetical protein